MISFIFYKLNFHNQTRTKIKINSTKHILKRKHVFLGLDETLRLCVNNIRSFITEQ